MNKRKIFSAYILSFLLVFTVFFSFMLRTENTAKTVFSIPMDFYFTQNSGYIGGYPAAFILELNGVIVDEVGFVETELGNATLGNLIKKGDFITKIDGDKIENSNFLIQKIENSRSEVVLTLLRDGKEQNITVLPYIETLTKTYKLGLKIRDTISGVGMITFVKENGSFGALGHLIMDSTAGEVPIKSGYVYDCKIVDVIKGKKGTAGELKASMFGRPIGTIFANTQYGIYGKLYSLPFAELFEFGKLEDVKPGKAYILTTISNGPTAYEIEIIKAVYQTESSTKGMFIRVTDKRLIDKTGGIVQGMSGSPIMQDGKIIGAVTHVLINDPKKGYAIYIDWMLEKA